MAQTPRSAPSFHDNNDPVLLINKNQLWTLLKALASNLTDNVQREGSFPENHIHIPPPVTDIFNTTANATASGDELSLQEVRMLVYVAIFFLWYGGVIFMCLIGFGVYKKKGHDMYKNFVDRQDIKEELKKLKEKEREQKKLTRLSSFASYNSSVFPTSDSGHSPDHGYAISFNSGHKIGKMLTQIPSAQSDEEEMLMETTDNHSLSTNCNHLNNSIPNGQVKFLV